MAAAANTSLEFHNKINRGSPACWCWWGRLQCGQTGWSDPTEGGLPCPPPSSSAQPAGNTEFFRQGSRYSQTPTRTPDPFLGVEGFWRRAKEPVEGPREEMPKI